MPCVNVLDDADDDVRSQNEQKQIMGPAEARDDHEDQNRDHQHVQEIEEIVCENPPIAFGHVLLGFVDEAFFSSLLNLVRG